MVFHVAGARVLVTGGTGMIGQAIVRHLQQAGADVTTLSRRGARPGNPDHTALAGDINDPDSLDFQGVDAVVHGAAWVGFGLSPEKEVQLMHTNVEGTRNVLDAAARDGVRKVVHVGSVAALGDCMGKPRDERWFHERPRSSNPPTNGASTKPTNSSLPKTGWRPPPSCPASCWVSGTPAPDCS